jgi:hypothetical protein
MLRRARLEARAVAEHVVQFARGLALRLQGFVDDLTHWNIALREVVPDVHLLTANESLAHQDQPALEVNVLPRQAAQSQASGADFLAGTFWGVGTAAPSAGLGSACQGGDDAHH